MIKRRRRFKQEQPLRDRIASFASEVRQKASLLPSGTEKDEMLKKLHQADTAFDIVEWIGARDMPPK